MFILSIIPLYLTTDSDGVAVNQSNQTDVLEHRIMELEGLLSSMILKQYFGQTVDGVNNTDFNAVRTALEAARAEELALMQQTGQISDNDAYARLDYLNRMDATIDQRINDLSLLLAALNGGTTLDYNVSGVDNTSVISVAAELERVLTYKQEVQVSKDFWNQIISSETSIINRTNGSTTDDTTDSTTSETNDTNQNTITIIPLEFTSKDLREALSRRAIANLQAIISSVSQNTDVNELLSKIEAVTNELKRELKFAGVVVSSDGTDQSRKSINSLNAELKTLLGQKELRELIAGVESSLRTELLEAFNELGSLV